MAAALSIRYRLPLLIAAILLAVIVVYGGAAYREIEDSALVTAGARLGEVGRQLGTVLAGQARQVASATGRVAGERAVRAFTADPTAAAAERVREVLASEGGDALVAAELLDADGRLLLEWRDSTAFPRDEAASPAVLRRLDGAAATVGPLRAEDGRVFFPSVARVGGEEADAEEGSGAVLVRWHSVGSGEGSRTIEKLIGSGAQLLLANRDGRVWTDFGKEVAAPPVDLRAALDVGAAMEYHPDDADTRVGLAVPVEGTPWALLVDASRASVIAPAREVLPWLALVGVALLVLGTGSAWVLSRGITGSVRGLAGAAAAISEGDYGHRAVVNRADELGTLATAFNVMAAAVEKAHQALERKVAELSVMEGRHRTVRDRLQHVMASSPSLIYARPVNGGDAPLAWISENVERLLGYTVEEARAPGWWVANLHPEDRELLAPDGHFPAPTTDTVREYRFLTASGEVRWLRDEQRLLPGTGEAEVEIVGALSDITERVRLEEQFRRSQKLEAVGRLAGGVAHDFNNLLTVIVGEADMALLDQEPPPELAAALREIRAAGERASHLTRQLLVFSSRNVIENATFPLNALVRDVHNMMRRLIGEDISLELRLAPDTGNVTADRGQIEQVLVNLVVNARDASEPGGRIVVGTRRVALDEEYVARHHAVQPGEYVVLEVSDTGTGMTPEVQAHLFEPFFTTKEQGKGTGLGLATSYGIARQFGGHIEAYSEPAVGTTMKVYLPLATESASDAAPAGPPPERGHETILVVEDDAQVRAITSRILTAQGYTVLEAPDGEGAIATLEDPDRRIDLLLTDVVMPRLGGRALAARAVELRPGLPVLFASGYSDEVIVQNQLLGEGIELIQKPFNRDALVRKVREVLDRPTATA